MPELPEVETVCRGLSASIVDRKITYAENFRPNLRIAFPENFGESLKGRVIKSISRRAKYILITLDNDAVIIAHLGMSGKMVVLPNFQNERKKHDHAVIRLDDGKEVVFNDPRRFGLITFSDKANINNHKLIAHLGVEPLEDVFDGKFLFERFKGRTSPVKLVIMDASIVVGVGNIYACEALFRSGISPLKKSGEVSRKKCDELAGHIKDVLKEAIKSGGSTLKDYVNSTGDGGYFQHNFKVYGQEGEPCISCSNPIKRVKQSGRSSFYCEHCQK